MKTEEIQRKRKREVNTHRLEVREEITFSVKRWIQSGCGHMCVWRRTKRKTERSQQMYVRSLSVMCVVMFKYLWATPPLNWVIWFLLIISHDFLVQWSRVLRLQEGRGNFLTHVWFSQRLTHSVVTAMWRRLALSLLQPYWVSENASL